MGPIDLQTGLETAKTAARAATELLQGARSQPEHWRTKSNPKDLVTEWDLRSEECILAQLAAGMPGVPCVAEESGSHEGQATGVRWLVDPIDGTVNFAHGLPFFAVSIALELEGVPVVGVVSAPALGWEFHAALGTGAYLNGERISVSEVVSLESAVLATGFPYDRATSSHNFAHWEHFQRRAGACRRFGAASLDLCMVACGWLDGYWESRLSPWDLSAGALVVREAGGMVSSITGEPFSSDTGNAIASNGRIHDMMVEELKSLPPLVER